MLVLYKKLGILSIAAKAGKVVSGEFMCEHAIQDGTAFLVLIAEDASANTCKQFINTCDYYSLPYRICLNGDTLGKLIGKQSRKTVAITDEGFARQIIIKLDSCKDMEV